MSENEGQSDPGCGRAAVATAEIDKIFQNDQIARPVVNVDRTGGVRHNQGVDAQQLMILTGMVTLSML